MGQKGRDRCKRKYMRAQPTTRNNRTSAQPHTYRIGSLFENWSCFGCLHAHTSPYPSYASQNKRLQCKHVVRDCIHTYVRLGTLVTGCLQNKPNSQTNTHTHKKKNKQHHVHIYCRSDLWLVSNEHPNSHAHAFSDPKTPYAPAVKVWRVRPVAVPEIARTR